MINRSERLSCETCTRKFLSASARQRHYKHNPSHAKRTTETPYIGTHWIEFDSAFKTFLPVPPTLTTDDIGTTYDRTSDSVHVTGAVTESIPVDTVPTPHSPTLSWTLGGSYLTISILKDAP